MSQLLSWGAVYLQGVMVEGVVYLTNSGTSIVVHIILVGNEENTIVCVHAPELFAEVVCPLGRLV